MPLPGRKGPPPVPPPVPSPSPAPDPGPDPVPVPVPTPLPTPIPELVVFETDAIRPSVSGRGAVAGTIGACTTGGTGATGVSTSLGSTRRGGGTGSRFVDRTYVGGGRRTVTGGVGLARG